MNRAPEREGSGPSRPVPSAIAAVARTLGIDALTAEVLRALRAEGCRSIVLKGPAFRRHLHADGSPRAYGDLDLLVAPHDLARAGAALSGLGFEMALDHRDSPNWSEPHAQEWGRPGGPRVVDLHWRIAGVGAPAEDAWRILWEHTEPLTVAGEEGAALAAEGIELLAALHAAHHGRTHPRPLGDLERALSTLDRDTWASAARLAAELDAVEALATGLRLVPAGEQLAAELELPVVTSRHRRLMAGDHAAGAEGLVRIMERAP